jgi:hypothetical protein
MDPYLETPAFWPDFHGRFITYWCDVLADLLPANYEARLGERVYLVEPPAPERKLTGPDLSVSRGEGPSSTSPAPAGVVTLEPVTIPLVILDEPRETYIEILHRPGRTLVAVLELLSPANKEEPGRGAYLAKRNALLRQAVHLVELDLLVGGRRIPLRDPLPPDDYYALVSRSDRRPDCNVYHWSVRQALPPIPVPLIAPDPDVWVGLDTVFGIAYRLGRYARSLAYDGPPPAPLRPDDRIWAGELARSRTAG